MPQNRIYHSVVLVKQVPDTHNVTGEVMTAEGTMNRSALPAIFNPEDLNALEMALSLREQHGGSVTVLTMGPMQAADILREALFRGADRVVLLSDRKFAGADTQATSYTLKCAVEKLGSYDLVFCGRQAIDGDTAQVGPQVAEKLGVPQITYAEAVLDLQGDEIIVRRAFDLGTELVSCQLPCLLTVVTTANRPRPASARKRITYKLAAVPGEYTKLLKKWGEFADEQALADYLAQRKLNIEVWTAADLQVDEAQLGLAGSPTQVYKVNYVVLEATDSKDVLPTAEGIQGLIAELVQEYMVG
ncbi:MAG: electron transfer flavoprotein subunit beta [Anaerolineales bacterium]|nr:electron transfer flavoprotein subunit beta/FixA family protein [Anaerolineae bacterium]PWB52812.1 MAG: electron transfer flavoprotein subunit beta [Anaerolineales bacterium]